MLVYGGMGTHFYNNLSVYNIEKDEWKESHLSEFKPSPMINHRIANLKDRYILMFGGFTVFGEMLCFKQATNESFLLDLETLQWRKFSNPMNFMPPRGGHTMNVVGEYVVVFGGTGQGGKPLMDC